MPYQLWSQDIFSKGEISPLLYGRVSIAPYYNGLKTATNVITYPQGAAGKRFGTVFQNLIEDVDNANQIYFKTMQYLNECVYLMVFTPNVLTIYLEGVEVASIVTPIGSNDIRLIDHTVLSNVFRVTTGMVAPQDITRRPSAANVISAASADLLTLTTPVLTGLIVPVRFTTSGTLPTTVPQVQQYRTYFAVYTSTTEAQIYNTAVDAKAGVNAFTITNNGTGTNNLIPQNTWAINAASFRYLPVYDFNEIDYDGFTFTLGATSGNSVTLTSSSAVFIPSGYTNLTTPYIGGTFSNGIGGNYGGIARIVSVTSSTIAVVQITSTFTSTSILGSTSFLTQVAWSDVRGWPRCCSSFQNRAFFANSDSLPNGLWGSVINDYNDFDDSESDADNAISWYPTSDDIAYIRFIVPYRSLTIHTNSGVFSTPLSVETAITPTNFSLTIQDSTPAQSVQPRGIDNQIIILSGNDAHSLLWDGFNNAYQSNIISVANEQLIRDPVDEAAFVDLVRAGSRYMLIINADGSMAIYQTLISEDVQGFTPAVLEQSYGNAYFRWVATTNDGRGWFACERELATGDSPVAITGFTPYVAETDSTPAVLSTLIAVGSNFDTSAAIAVQFSTAGVMPNYGTLSAPILIVSDEWYWVIGKDSDSFYVFLKKSDADLLVNSLKFVTSGTSSTVDPWTLKTFYTIEELSFDSKVDCALNYDGTPTSTFSSSVYNAQLVKINGDGYGFEYTGIDSEVQTIAHGEAVDVSVANIGFPINVNIEPLPLSIFGSSPKTSNLMTPTHIRSITFMFADTIGGEIVTEDSSVPIAMQRFNEVPFGSPPEPVNGIFEYGLLAGWDDYQNIGFHITHSEPFDIKLIGIFYKVEA